MKLCAGFLRIFCWILAIFATIYVFVYAYFNPTDHVGIYIRFPIVAIAIHTIPFPCFNLRKRREFFLDNLKVFKEYGQQKSLNLNRNQLVSYHSKKANKLDASPEGVLAASLLNYIGEKDLADEQPYVQLKHRKWGKGLEVVIRCTWYRKFVFYWIPANEKDFFENFRFNKVIELEENWFACV